MSAPASLKWQATAHDRMALVDFISFCRSQGFILCHEGDFLVREITPEEQVELLNRRLGIDSAQLAAERVVQLNPGAECACGE